MRNLKRFVDERNFMLRMFARGAKAHLFPALDQLTESDKARLRNALEDALSPENLCCDGELRGTALRAKAAMLNGALKELNRL